MAAKRASLKETKVSSLKMPYEIKVNVKSLLESSAGTNAQIEVSRISLLRSKMPKVEGRINEDDTMESIAVEDLIFKGKEPIFDGEIRGKVLNLREI